MSKAFQYIADEAKQLSADQRLKLASLLLDLDGNSTDPEVSAAWEEEIQARIRAVDENRVEGIDLETVMKNAEDNLNS